jgi:hypothetical protein
MNKSAPAQNGGVVQLSLSDFNQAYMLEELPPDVECPICYYIKPDIVECTNCFQSGCKECNDDFTSKKKSGNIGQRKYECTTCHSVNVFSNQNKILQEIMMNLNF